MKLKILILSLACATVLRAADAANDVIVIQRNAANDDNVQRNITSTANALVITNGSSAPTSTLTPTGLISVGTGTLTATGLIVGQGTGSHVFGTTNTVTLAAGAVTATGAGSFGGILSTSLTTDATGGTGATGALQVAGGASFTKIVNVGNYIFSSHASTAGEILAGSDGSGFYFANGGTAYALPVNIGSASTTTTTIRGAVAIPATTEATTGGAGSITTAGGIYSAKRIITATTTISSRAIHQVTNTATAAGTTVLATASTMVQIFTGSTTQSVTLPAANLAGAGYATQFILKNRSSGTVTINRAGSDTIDGATSYALLTGTSITLISDSVSDWTLN